ncbi:MAG TPA: BMP family ABC transporter substrate-binding protein [Candidatus Binatia bacterium]|nr:BMP family ABC transporter substrate-binding protein [Candidatus Binatia bacterium]
MSTISRRLMGRTAIATVLAASAIAGGMFALTGAASAADVKKIAIMTPDNPNDQGWNQQGYDAAKAVAEKYGLEFMPATGLGYGDVHPQARELADDGASLIIAHASGYNTAVPEVGAEKKVPVAIVDKEGTGQPGVLADYTLSGHEGAYLAGALAAKMSKSKTVGIVVSGEPPSWNSQSAAFANGVHATDSSVKVLYAVIGPAAYDDKAGGKRVSDQLIGAGADVLFGQGDGASFGMVQAVETAKTPTWFIDVIGDKSKDHGARLLSSVIWDMVPVYSQMVEDLKADKFGTHEYAISLKDDSVKLLHTKNIPDDVWASIEDLRKKIIDGSVKVDRIEDAQKVRALMSSVSAAAQ